MFINTLILISMMNNKAIVAIAAVVVIIIAAAAIYLVVGNGSDDGGDSSVRSELAPGDVVVYENTEYSSLGETSSRQTIEVLFVTDDYIVIRDTLVNVDGTYEDVIPVSASIIKITISDDELTERTGTVTVDTDLGEVECEVWGVNWYGYVDGVTCEAWIGDDGVIYGTYIADGEYWYRSILTYTTLLGDAPEVGTADYSTDTAMEAGDVFEYITVHETDYEGWDDSVSYEYDYYRIEILSLDGDTAYVDIDHRTKHGSSSTRTYMPVEDVLEQYVYGHVTSNGYAESWTERVLTYLGYADATVCRSTADGVDCTEWVDEDGNLLLSLRIVYEDGEAVSVDRTFVLASGFVLTS